MTAKRCRLGSGAARGGLAFVLALLLVACEKQPAVQASAPAAPVAVKKVEQPANAGGGNAADAQHSAEDAALAAKVKAALSAEPALKGVAIDVTAKDGNVSLFGTASSPRQIAAAGKVASAVNGVKAVNNKLLVLAGS